MGSSLLYVHDFSLKVWCFIGFNEPLTAGFGVVLLLVFLLRFLGFIFKFLQELKTVLVNRSNYCSTSYLKAKPTSEGARF